ncbi:MAG TPA: hypothetical protein VFY45_15645, partial [Baekduia sp.]|nr:hypothetical protein [Baekduia sp.]
MSKTAMRTRRLRAVRGIGAGLVAAAAMALGAPAAQADLLSNFEAFPASTQAGAHADATTKFTVTDVAGSPVDTLRFHLPTGLLGSVANFATCKLADFTQTGANACAPETQVGEGSVLLNLASRDAPSFSPMPATVHMLVAGRGDTALLGVRLLNGLGTAVLHINVRPDDYGLDATLEGFQNILGGSDVTLWGVPWDHWDSSTQLREERLPFMANPATCGKEALTSVEVNSYKNPNVLEPYSVFTPAQTGCDQLRFEPDVSTEVTSPFVSSPSGLTFGIDVPQDESADGLATPPIRDVTTVLPEGLTINPALANGLEACTDAQLGKGSSEPSTCPAASRVGTAEFEVPALKDPHVSG